GLLTALCAVVIARITSPTFVMLQLLPLKAGILVDKSTIAALSGIGAAATQALSGPGCMRAAIPARLIPLVPHRFVASAKVVRAMVIRREPAVTAPLLALPACVGSRFAVLVARALGTSVDFVLVAVGAVLSGVLALPMSRAIAHAMLGMTLVCEGVVVIASVVVMRTVAPSRLMVAHCRLLQNWMRTTAVWRATRDTPATASVVPRRHSGGPPLEPPN